MERVNIWALVQGTRYVLLLVQGTRYVLLLVQGTRYVFLRHYLTITPWNLVNEGNVAASSLGCYVRCRRLVSLHTLVSLPHGPVPTGGHFVEGRIGVTVGVGPAERREFCYHFPESIRVSHRVFLIQNDSRSESPNESLVNQICNFSTHRCTQ
jgi:hypothetical protein